MLIVYTRWNTNVTTHYDILVGIGSIVNQYFVNLAKTEVTTLITLLKLKDKKETTVEYLAIFINSVGHLRFFLLYKFKNVVTRTLFFIVVI